MLVKTSMHSIKERQTILAGDVGATKTDLAVLEWNGKSLSVIKSATYKTADYKNIAEMIRHFAGNDHLPGPICLGVAGPVQNNQAYLTNVYLNISGDDLSDAFNVPALLVNDLEATAHGLAMIDEDDMHVLHTGQKDPKGNIAIIAPGTGLGEAGLIFKEHYYYPFATEGGHCDFAPRNELDIELYRFLQIQFGHVSWERVVSGQGICAIYDFLYHEKDMEAPAWLKEKMLVHDKASAITSNADECDICKKTTELFIRYLAEESANLVLKLKATGGLFIAGGILPQILFYVHEDYFMKHFCNAGRLKELLQSVPIYTIMSKHVPLLGAGFYGLQHTSVKNATTTFI